MERRTIIRGMAAVAGTTALGGSLWRAVAVAAADPVQLTGDLAEPLDTILSAVPPAAQKQAAFAGYGALKDPDSHGLRLPSGFVGRVVARTGERVGDSRYRWHEAPDGGACFADGDGWIYVSNSEVRDTGGAGAIRFDRDGRIIDAYRILERTQRNCAGGATPWNTWLSCEEVNHGAVFETDPWGKKAPVRHPAMGLFRHEAAAVDPERQVVYLTEDEPDSGFYRFVPTGWPALAEGRLEVLCADGPGQVRWEVVPDPSGKETQTRRQVQGMMKFDGGEGCVYAPGSVWFTSKNDGKVWRVDVVNDVVEVAYDSRADKDSPLTAADNITRTQVGELFVAEDKGEMEIVVISPEGEASSFVRVTGQPDSEITGPAFSPDGTRMYFSSQRGRKGSDDGGVTYEIRGPFRSVLP